MGGASMVMTGGAPAVEWAGPGMLRSPPQRPGGPTRSDSADVSSDEGDTLL